MLWGRAYRVADMEAEKAAREEMEKIKRATGGVYGSPPQMVSVPFGGGTYVNINPVPPFPGLPPGVSIRSNPAMMSIYGCTCPFCTALNNGGGSVVDPHFTGSLELAVGSVRGARSFAVTPDGYLTGINYRQVWVPGENHAVCRKFDGPYSFGGRIVMAQRKTEPEPHDMAKCSHGFYGFYDGSNDYHDEGKVAGIIEGYGETMIGTRGFRCMKARILALRIDDRVDNKTVGSIMEHYEGIPLFVSFAKMIEAFPPDVPEIETPEPKPYLPPDV